MTDNKPTSKTDGGITRSKTQKPVVQESVSDVEEDSDIEARKRKLREKKSAGDTSKRKRTKVSSDEDDDPRPTKANKRGNKK